MKSDYDPITKIDVIERKIEAIEEALHFLVNLHATNETVLYSPKLAEQVGESHAAHAFNVFQRSLFELEITRLLSIWDAPGRGDGADQSSFPIVAKMLDDVEVVSSLVERMRASYTDMPVLTPGMVGKSDFSRVAADDAAAEFKLKVAEVIQRVSSISGESYLTEFRNFRDKHIAHLLDQTHRERKIGKPISMPKFGKEDDLLSASLEIHRDLRSLVKLSWIEWDVWVQDSKRNASYLWDGCTMKPIR